MKGPSGFFPALGQADPNAKYLVVAEGLLNWGGGFFLVARPIYLYAIGLNPTTVGALISLQAFLAVVLSIPIAMLSDALGRKRFVVYGMLLDGAGAFLFFYSSDIVALVAAQVLFAVVNAAAGAPFLALFTGTTTKDNRNELFVLLGFFGLASLSVGAYASGLPVPLESLLKVGYLDGFRFLFLVVSITSLAGGVIVALFVSETRERPPEGRRLTLERMVKLPKRSMSVVKKFSVIGFTGFGAGLVIPLLSLWFTLRFDVTTLVVGPLFGTIFLITAFASLLTPALARRRGSVFTIVVTQLSAIVLLVSIPLSPDYLSAGALMVARSTLANMAGPITNSFTMGLIHPDERATASSIIQLFDSVPRAYAPTLGGYLISLGLINLPFFITAVLYLASSSLFYFLFRNVRAPDFEAAGAASGEPSPLP